MLTYKNDGMQVPVYAWTDGVPFDENAKEQTDRVAKMPFMFHHVAVMPDVHWGMGATVGSVIATKGAIIPAAVGVDLGCGMQAALTDLSASDLPDDLTLLRHAIEKAVPHGRTNNGKPGDRGAWGTPQFISSDISDGLVDILSKNPEFSDMSRAFNQAGTHLGTLGTGNHFIEVCLDEQQRVWIVLHSGSRGIGNRIGTYFIERAKEQAAKYFYEEHLPDPDLAYLVEGTPIFQGYIEAVTWAQRYARENRNRMMMYVVRAIESTLERNIFAFGSVIDCHHNYISVEEHFGTEGVIVTRKGAVNASVGRFGIIPGSMGAKSYIVSGRGNPNSFESCSHGAGRVLGRREAKREISIEEFQKEMTGINADLSPDKIDEAPSAYKSIDAVMAAQADLVNIEHTLKQVLVVKG